MDVIMRLALLVLMATFPCAAQFRYVKIWFSGIGCASCTESLGDRARRLRGVESATVDAKQGTLEVQLAEQNRVRPEQIRDLIEQDGTKALRALVRASGDVSQTDGRWMLKVGGSSSAYEITAPDLKSGPQEVSGEIRDVHPSSGSMRIEAAPPK
jgi:hypothetical protein